MSAFFFALNRDGSKFSPIVAEAMMAQIDDFGHDSKQLIVRDNFAIGYQARWTTKEELGEQQPILLDDHSWLMFLGRIDNRHYLLERLRLKPDLEISDAELVARYLKRHSVDQLNEFVGPFVLVVFDQQTQSVLAARDPMGGRYLVAAVSEQRILLATYEMALVAHPSVDYSFNEEKIAAGIARQQETKSLSLVRGLEPLEPGEALEISNNGKRVFRFYRPRVVPNMGDNTDQQYAQEFRRLLNQAVARRLRGIGDVATMLSGGLDSVPIAIAASQLSAVQEQHHQALSWVFEQYSDADERQYSKPVCEQFAIRQHLICCDEVWPKFDKDTHLNPVFPFSTPYSEYQQETFRVAKQQGISHILTGIHGDMLYGHGESVVYELLQQGQIRQAIKLFMLYWRHTSNRRVLIKNTLLKPIPWLRRLLDQQRMRRYQAPAWLQADIAEQLRLRPHPLYQESQSRVRPLQWQNLFGGFAGNDMALGRTMEAKYQIDRRYPLRDRDLCEFMASVPSTQLISGMIHRPIVLNAYANELPENIRKRNDKTGFNSAISASIAADVEAQRWFKQTDAAWKKYVKDCDLDSWHSADSATSVLQWQCAYYNFWRATCYDAKQGELGAGT